MYACTCNDVVHLLCYVSLPTHDTSVFRRVVADPPVRLSEVVEHDRLSCLCLALQDDGRVGEHDRHALRVSPEAAEADGQRIQTSRGHQHTKDDEFLVITCHHLLSL